MYYVVLISCKYVCMYVYVRTCTYMYVYVRICTHMYMYYVVLISCKYVCMYVYISVYIRILKSSLNSGHYSILNSRLNQHMLKLKGVNGR